MYEGYGIRERNAACTQDPYINTLSKKQLMNLDLGQCAIKLTRCV